MLTVKVFSEEEFNQLAADVAKLTVMVTNHRLVIERLDNLMANTRRSVEQLEVVNELGEIAGDASIENVRVDWLSILKRMQQLETSSHHRADFELRELNRRLQAVETHIGEHDTKLDRREAEFERLERVVGALSESLYFDMRKKIEELQAKTPAACTITYTTAPTPQSESSITPLELSEEQRRWLRLGELVERMPKMSTLMHDDIDYWWYQPIMVSVTSDEYTGPYADVANALLAAGIGEGRAS